jgi:nucleoside-triphosphatase THEP1
LVDSAARLGIRAGGILSPAVFQDGLKVGIDLLDLHGNTRRRLAVRKFQESAANSTENWQFDDEALIWGNSILLYSWCSRLLVLDEIGLLELKRGTGLTNAIKLVSSRKYQLAVVTMRPELLDLSLELWPWGEVFAIEPDRQPEVPA